MPKQANTKKRARPALKALIISAAAALTAHQAEAASARNGHVEVSSSTPGVTGIGLSTDGKDFIVFAPDAAGSFKADVSVSAVGDWVLLSEASVEIGAGGGAGYRVAKYQNNDVETVATGSIDLPHIEFSANPVIVGIGDKRTSETPNYPPTTPPGHPHRLTATVKPAKFAASVAFSTDNSQRIGAVKIGNESPSKIIVKVSGITKTPASAPEGDAKVIASLDGAALASAKALVIIPAGIHKPFPQFDGIVEGKNIVTSRKTTPSNSLVPLGYVFVEFGWHGVILTIQVDDQFGKSLHPIYAGAPVSESGISLNQVISHSGTYSDPVGTSDHDLITMLPEYDSFGNPNPDIELALAEPVPGPIFHDHTSKSPVEVEGHALTPGIKGRRFLTSKTGRIIISWK